MDSSMKGLVIIVFQMISEGLSIQCETKLDDGTKKVTDCKGGMMGDSTDYDIKALECIKDRGSLTYRSLAAEYLDSYKECLAKFDSCSYYEYENQFACTCPMFYIRYIKPLGMELGECKDWPEYNLTSTEFRRVRDDWRNFTSYLQNTNDPEIIACMGTPINLKSTMGIWRLKLKQSKTANKIRLTNTYEICTCGPDGCDASAKNKVTFKPDAPDDTTITATNELSENTAFPDDTDTDPDTDKSKSTMVTDSDNDKRNVTTNVTPGNDKTKSDKIDGSGNDKKMSTTENGATKQFLIECFAKILIGEIIL